MASCFGIERSASEEFEYQEAGMNEGFACVLLLASAWLSYFLDAQPHDTTLLSTIPSLCCLQSIILICDSKT